MRDRLIELLNKKYDHFCDQCGVNKDSRYTENLAEYLLDNGVVVPPCKVGDTLYVIAEMPKQVVECTVIGFYAMENRITITSDIGMICDESIGKTVFTDREDAVKALRGGDDK